MKKMPTKEGYLIALLLFSTGVFTLHGNMLGKTLASAFLPMEGPATPAEAVAPPDTLASPDPHPSGQLYSPYKIEFKGLKPLPPEMIDSETLWLARCIFSETKREREQELVAWIVRNRVETQYRGKSTYRDVVLDPYQFSAFNPGRTRNFYMGLSPTSKVPGWQKALRIAHEVRHASPQFRPFSKKTRHFYSEQSMVGPKHPNWAHGLKPVRPEREYPIDTRRFRFYEGIF